MEPVARSQSSKGLDIGIGSPCGTRAGPSETCVIDLDNYASSSSPASDCLSGTHDRVRQTAKRPGKVSPTILPYSLESLVRFRFFRGTRSVTA